MARPRVIALILPARGVAADPTIEALARQSRSVDQVVVVGDRDPLPTGSQSQSTWVWLLERGLEPEPTALEALLDAVEEMGDAHPPALLVSKVLTEDGALDPASGPVAEVHTPSRVVAALDHRLVALRAAPAGSILLQGEALAATGVRTASQAVDRELEWTSRLLRHELGVLVPASVVIRPPKARRPRGRRTARLASAVRLIAGLEQLDRLWFTAHLGERALAARRSRRDS